jgi:hypothetical protein
MVDKNPYFRGSMNPLPMANKRLIRLSVQRFRGSMNPLNAAILFNKMMCNIIIYVNFMQAYREVY